MERSWVFGDFCPMILNTPKIVCSLALCGVPTKAGYCHGTGLASSTNPSWLYCTIIVLPILECSVYMGSFTNKKTENHA